jgi:hypothetical protein
MVGTHPRNVEPMVQHRKDLHLAATRGTETVLDALERSGDVITFQLVARRAGVSRSWLYTQEPLRARIATLRREHPRPAHASAERATDASKDAIMRTLRQRLADRRLPKQSSSPRTSNSGRPTKFWLARSTTAANTISPTRRWPVIIRESCTTPRRHSSR